MTDTTVLTLAAGDAIRMHGRKKQLLQIGATNVLERILAQIKHYGLHTILVTHDKEIASYHDNIHVPENRNTTCDSLLSTSDLWGDRTIVLLGDVIYSHKTMDDIVNCRSKIRVFGNSWEIFAIVFTKEKHDEVIDALEKARKHRRGKLRYFYHIYCGFAPDFKAREAKAPDRFVFFYVRDWTRDVDTPYKYERLIKEVVITGKIDDKK